MKNKSNPIWVLIALLIVACGPQEKEKKEMSEEDLRAKASELSKKYIITDGHIDLPYKMVDDGHLKNGTVENVSVRAEAGDFDFPRAKAGGLDAPFMSIYIPARYQETGGAKEFADSLITMTEQLASTYPDHFEIARTPSMVEKIVGEGKVALPMGMENGAPIEDDLANVAYFKDRGISYVTLTHSTDNQICDSSYDTTDDTWSGLSPFGEQVVAEMNRVGIMVDISHVSDSAFYDVMAMTKAPAIASHSSCRSFTPGWERNMNDTMIKRLAENGGVIQINFGSAFLDGLKKDLDDSIDTIVRQYQAENSLAESDPAITEYHMKLKAELNPYSSVEKTVDHIDHVVEIAGIDHVGIGSDYDGVGDSLPVGLKDVSQYPNLIYELLKRGYSDEDIEKICYKNVWRVWNRVIEIAEQS